MNFSDARKENIDNVTNYNKKFIEKVKKCSFKIFLQQNKNYLLQNIILKIKRKDFNFLLKI
jgi:hypothetical protein